MIITADESREYIYMTLRLEDGANSKSKNVDIVPRMPERLEAESRRRSRVCSISETLCTENFSYNNTESYNNSGFLR